MKILQYLWDHRTTALGYVVVIFSVLASSDLFSVKTIKVFLLIIGVVTAVLGHYNNSRKSADEKTPS